MIKIIQRGGAGLHTVSALLDFCTVEGNLPNYPDFEPGNNLHSQLLNHIKISKQFYNSSLLHHLPDKEFYKIKDGKVVDHLPDGIVKHSINDNDNDIILAPIANDSFGRILIMAMAVGKTRNKKMPPDDNCYDYSNCLSLSDKLEKLTYSIRDELLKNFSDFHGHAYPAHQIDVMWFYHNEYQNLNNVIISCGWTPKIKKVKNFCNLITKFNKPYYDMLENIIKVYNQIINREMCSCNLTFFEVAAVLGLIAEKYNLDTASKMKLFTTIPTTTTEFFDLCQ